MAFAAYSSQSLLRFFQARLSEGIDVQGGPCQTNFALKKAKKKEKNNS